MEQEKQKKLGRGQCLDLFCRGLIIGWGEIVEDWESGYLGEVKFVWQMFPSFEEEGTTRN